MPRLITFLLLIFILTNNSKAQVIDSIPVIAIADSSQVPAPAVKLTSNEKTYKIKPWIDFPLTAAGTAWTLYGFSIIYGRDSVPVSELARLNRNDINSFDRGSANRYSTKAKSVSDMFFYGSMPLPLILLFDKKIRKESARVALLYLESMAVTGTMYTVAAMSANRFRPYAYNPSVPLQVRTRGGARNSFYAGHVAVVGTSVFFTAKIFTDYHPEKNKWIFFGAATAITTAQAIARLRSGQHFPSDIILGSTLGPLVGFMVPHIHKNKVLNDKLAIVPTFDRKGGGFTAFYKF